eukprot:scaffold25469_cov77-Cyclotella_meneghiniana.AAC.6
MSQSNSLLVTATSDDSIFVNTGLYVGMSISVINGTTLDSLEDGLQMLMLADMKPGWFHVIAKTVPSIGTLYEVSHRFSGMLRQVFIPNKKRNSTLHHCQSNYHIHTTFWVRRRYVQRALMGHDERTVKDINTISPL